MRGATLHQLLLAHYLHFYSHAPCGARPSRRLNINPRRRFLLTRPMRGATRAGVFYPEPIVNFYSHAPCGARRKQDSEIKVQGNFYSHAPCGARLHPGNQICFNIKFLLTRPMRGATHNHLPHEGTTLFLLTRPMRGATATYSTRNFRASYIQEADSKIIPKYSIKFNILHDSAIKSRRTCLSFMHHNTFACYSP